MGFRKYTLGSYEEMRAQHSWQVPERYNIAHDVCDKHERDRLAMIWEDWRGNERRVSFGELQDLSNKFANVLEANGVERGDRVATLLPSLPETAAVFLGTYKRGAILLSMSVLYGRTVTASPRASPRRSSCWTRPTGAIALQATST
jgi:acetyl-CoA synthetase